MAIISLLISLAVKQYDLIQHLFFNYTWSICIFVTLISFFAYWRWRKSQYVQLIDKIPGPKTVPLLGNILHFTNFISTIHGTGKSQSSSSFKDFKNYLCVLFFLLRAFAIDAS